MNTEFIKEWTNELRTGDRKQGKGQLHCINEDGSEAFCCLGVAEDMLVARGIERRVLIPDALQYVYVSLNGDRETGLLTDRAMKYMGINSKNPYIELPQVSHWEVRPGEEGRGSYICGLAELNDCGMSFEQIADVIDYFFGGQA